MIAFIQSKLFGYGAALLAVLFLALAVGQCSRALKAEHRLKHMERGLHLAQADLKRCEIDKANAQAALERQNAAVKALETEAKARKDASERAVKDAAKIAAAYRKSAADVLSAKTSNPDRCGAAVELVKGAIR